MPGWHDATRELQAAGKIQLVGVIQEQHPERCRLFHEWKQMDWPVLVDSLGLLGVDAVPLTFLVDEHGVIRKTRAKAADLEAFLATDYPAPAELPAPAAAADIAALASRASESTRAADSTALGDALFLTQDAARLDAAIDAYERARSLANAAGDAVPEVDFRLGVALRRRYEGATARPDDFRAAVAAWGRALERRPGQYIWRRRIEQYGPRLEKPYAFYDWVPEARAAITARGGTPPPLAVEPGGAEFASPSKEFRVEAAERQEPDARDALPKDTKRLVVTASAIAPARVAPGKTARVHVRLEPDRARHAHWNNEAGETVLWIRPPDGVEVDRPWRSVPNPKEPESTERRELEFELRLGETAVRAAKNGRVRVPAYVTYFVCEGDEGVCFYYRQDLTIEVEVAR